MKSNYPVDRSVLNFIHARDFYKKEDADAFRLTIGSHVSKFVPTPYGLDMQNFNMTSPEDDMIFGGMLGDYVKIDEDRSGIFRMPYHNLIHFESFDNLNEWRLAVALDDNTFTTYSHTSGAKTAIDGYEFDYHNLNDWIVETVVTVRKGDAVFYRPWVFHSFEEKLIFCHYIKGEA
jgi:hypothetical protein